MPDNARLRNHDMDYLAQLIDEWEESKANQADFLATQVGFPMSFDPALIRAADLSNVGAANQAVYFRVLYGGTITKIGLDVTTSSGNISVGVYANSGVGHAAIPAARKATSGAVACPGTGYQEVALTASVDVLAGDWIAISADNVTAVFRSSIPSEAVSNLAMGRCYKQSTAHPLPNPAASLTAITGRPIILVGVA